MSTRLNEFELKLLEQKIDMYPDIVEIVLKKMRMKTVLEIEPGNFERFIKLTWVEQYAKYIKKGQ